MHRKRLAIIGAGLLVLGALGPFSFADDLRHTGEVALALGLIASGCCLLIPTLPLRWRCSDSFPMAAPPVLVGLIAGVAVDRAMPGLLLGLGLGLAVVRLHCARRGRAVDSGSQQAQARSKPGADRG